MIVIPRHDPSRSGSGLEESANVLCSPFVGRYGDRSLRHTGYSVMKPVVDSACIVIARAVRQGRPCPTGPSSNYTGEGRSRHFLFFVTSKEVAGCNSVTGKYL